MKANADKWYLLVTCNTNITAKVEDFSIENSPEEKLLGVRFDSIFSLENYVYCLWAMASQKLHALARIVNYMEIEKRQFLMKALPPNLAIVRWFGCSTVGP